ncbi:MAG: TPM domain-containing protein, partial [Akkermansiaceae bacterium]|nr:TPM domain-containing protein [Akkermansiaceae bacterium]
PDRPVFDATGSLPTATIERLSKTLDAIREREQIDIMVVQLADTRGAPPEHIAREFANAWCRPLFHCVVLCIPSHPDSPWIFPGGTLMRHFNPAVVKTQVDEARRRAALERSEPAKLEAAAMEAADMLRIWVGDGTYWSRVASEQAMKDAVKAWNIRRLAKLLLPIGGAALVMGAVAAFVVIRLMRGWHAREFPEVSWQRRLGAPYAGGNDSSRILPQPP